ncbi:uncharacterized protein ccdc171 isoform X2 [Stigmatopora argus]
MENEQTKVPGKSPGTATETAGASDDGELTGRKMIHRLEEEKLKLTSAHNRQLSTLEAELARLRLAAERGDARGAELQLQVTAGRRDARRLSQSNRELTEQAAELRKILDLTRRARHEEGAALRQEADERHALMEDLTSEGQRLRRLVQCQEEALEEARRTMAALRDQEAQGRRSLEAEREARREEERRRELAQASEREALGKLASLGAQLLEAQRAHGEERDGGRHARRALRRLRTESERRGGDLSVALETAKGNAADLAGRLEDEERRHVDTCRRLQQALQTEALSEKLLEEIGETLRRQVPRDAKADGTDSGPGDVMRLLHLTLARLGEAERQVRDLLSACEKLERQMLSLGRLTGRQKRDLQEARRLSVELQERASRLQRESQDLSARNRELGEESQAHVSRLRRILRRLAPDGATAEPQSADLSRLTDELAERLSSELLDAPNKGLLSRSRRKSAAFLWACSLLLGATAHDRRRLSALAEQKRLLARRLAAAEEPAEELRRLADALAGDRDAPPAAGSAGVVGGRWKKYACAVAALSRWRALGRRSAALLWPGARSQSAEACAEAARPDGDEPEEAVESRRRRSERLSSTILARVGDPPPPDASPSWVRSEARAALARLLHGTAGPSESPPDISREARPWTPPPDDTKVAASRLRRHFLLLSRRLHSAEVERRSLRLRVAQMGRPEDGDGTVPAKHFHVVCADLRRALEGQEEARGLLEEHSAQRDALRRRLDAHAAERLRAHRALGRVAEALAETRKHLRGKDRSLRILTERLSLACQEKRRLEGRLRRREATGRRHATERRGEDVTVCPARKKKLPTQGRQGAKGHLPAQGPPNTG